MKKHLIVSCSLFCVSILTIFLFPKKGESECWLFVGWHAFVLNPLMWIACLIQFIYAIKMPKKGPNVDILVLAIFILIQIGISVWLSKLGFGTFANMFFLF